MIECKTILYSNPSAVFLVLYPTIAVKNMLIALLDIALACTYYCTVVKYKSSLCCQSQ